MSKPAKTPRRSRALASPDLAAHILRLVQVARMKRGERLGETALAGELGVSRTPVRRALEELAQTGAIERQAGGGYRLACDWNDDAFAALASSPPAEEDAYLRIAGDRLDGRLPDTIHESALERDYGLSTAQARRVLARMAQEAWLEKKPGYGWRFLPTFPDWRAYTQSYRFRIAIEPAAILDPDFSLDDAALDALEASQQRVLENCSKIGIAEIFAAGCRFHETIVRASGNPFMLDSIERINRMRRLMEYRVLAPQAIRAQTLEHLDILAALRSQDCEKAAALMHAHLEAAWRAKRETLRAGGKRMAEATY